MEHNHALVGQKADEPENNQQNEAQITEHNPQENTSMESLLDEQGGFSLDFPKQGEIRKGFIATIRDNEILVSIGTKSEGIISGRELEQIPPEERNELQLGQEIPVFVVAPEDQNGNVVLSYVRAREEQDWELVDRLLASSETLYSKLFCFNKG
jgi:small subunit ribosomal protein S1